MSRIDPIMKNLIGNENPDDLAQDILEVLTEGSNVPEAGNYYVFVYKPKTPGIVYFWDSMATGELRWVRRYSHKIWDCLLYTSPSPRASV